MTFDVNKAMKGIDPDEAASAADVARAVVSVADVAREIEQFHEAIRTAGVGSVRQLLEQQRQQAELVRNLSGHDLIRRIAEQADQFRRIAQQATQSMAAYHAQNAEISRQVKDALADYDAQIAQMSRQVLVRLT